MRVFLSYSREDRSTVERIKGALNAAGFDTFLDTDKLPIGQEYHARIKRAIDGSDLFVFLASEHSVRPRSYAMTELAYAEDKWRNPAGYIMPVLLDGFNADHLPAYIKPLTSPIGDDNIEARIVSWVEQRVDGLDPDGPDEHSPQARLARWTRLAQPPVRGRQRAFVGQSLIGIIVGIVFVGFGTVGSSMSRDFPGPSAAMEAAGWLFAAIGAGLFMYSLWMLFQGMVGSGTPVAVVILDREIRENSTTVKVETSDRKRLSLTPIRAGARDAHTGDLGWAYIRGKLLIDFFPARVSST